MLIEQKQVKYASTLLDRSGRLSEALLGVGLGGGSEYQAPVALLAIFFRSRREPVRRLTERSLAGFYDMVA